MTEEDKKLISKYMGWSESPYWWCEKCKEEKSPHHVTYVERCSDCGCPVIVKEDYSFDSNAAALCVQEMQKRRDWLKFKEFSFAYLWDDRNNDLHMGSDLVYFFMSNAENFFNALAAWIKEEKK